MVMEWVAKKFGMEGVYVEGLGGVAYVAIFGSEVIERYDVCGNNGCAFVVADLPKGGALCVAWAGNGEVVCGDGDDDAVWVGAGKFRAAH